MGQLYIDTCPECGQHYPAVFDVYCNFQPSATREPEGLCGNQRYSRELLMIGIMVLEIC